jgi:hypothetical protein
VNRQPDVIFDRPRNIYNYGILFIFFFLNKTFSLIYFALARAAPPTHPVSTRPRLLLTAHSVVYT